MWGRRNVQESDWKLSVLTKGARQVQLPKNLFSGRDNSDYIQSWGAIGRRPRHRSSHIPSEAKLNAIKYLILNSTQAELEIKTAKFSVSVIPKLVLTPQFYYLWNQD